MRILHVSVRPKSDEEIALSVEASPFGLRFEDCEITRIVTASSLIGELVEAIQANRPEGKFLVLCDPVHRDIVDDAVRHPVLADVEIWATVREPASRVRQHRDHRQVVVTGAPVVAWRRVR